PDQAREQRRLREDGHRVTSDRRSVTFHVTLDSARATQLYRTLPHEVGHWVDYQRHVARPGGDPGSDRWQALWDRYWRRPEREREDAAHRHADTVRRRLARSGRTPLPRT